MQNWTVRVQDSKSTKSTLRSAPTVKVLFYYKEFQSEAWIFVIRHCRSPGEHGFCQKVPAEPSFLLLKKLTKNNKKKCKKYKNQEKLHIDKERFKLPNWKVQFVVESIGKGFNKVQRSCRGQLYSNDLLELSQSSSAFSSLSSLHSGGGKKDLSIMNQHPNSESSSGMGGPSWFTRSASGRSSSLISLSFEVESV